MLNAYEEVVVDARMSHIMHHSRQEACHGLQVGKVHHEVAKVNKVMEVPSDFYYAQHVVIVGRLIALLLYTLH